MYRQKEGVTGVYLKPDLPEYRKRAKMIIIQRCGKSKEVLRNNHLGNSTKD